MTTLQSIWGSKNRPERVGKTLLVKTRYGPRFGERWISSVYVLELELLGLADGLKTER